MNGSTEPYWLEGQELVAIHREVIAASGCLAGIRDRGMLASALVAPQTLWYHAPKPPSLVDLAARLAYGLAKIHGFVDGNKRTAFIAAYTFLAMKWIVIEASHPSVLKVIEELARTTDEPGQAQTRFSDWLSSVTEATAQERQ